MDLQELQRIPVGIRESTLFIDTSKTKTLKHVAFMSHYTSSKVLLKEAYLGSFWQKCHRTILRIDAPEKQMLGVIRSTLGFENVFMHPFIIHTAGDTLIQSTQTLYGSTINL